ncbi:winged helix-turn-helix domain-containing protein [Bradyrhizobium neotropicale]|uniref:winged helix-turn-helix domain-containing protein n=1 Tax=Bradyrhizobium neotropicale TaxID=1497615 RepID=UPI001AD661FB|nr:winged helix-turn-helix domain-containing protein [Bradyrhizobium neotropicale]MBO4228042.1 hypothetical protein [Bradyrhizobium neotropicale]
MQEIAKTSEFVGRRPSIPFKSIGGKIARQDPTKGQGCPCCGAPLNANRPYVDRNTKSLIYRDGSLPLEPHELALMDILCRRSPGAVPYDDIVMAIWPDDNEPEDADKSMKVKVYALRRKIPLLGLQIINVRLEGYRLELPR